MPVLVLQFTIRQQFARSAGPPGPPPAALDWESIDGTVNPMLLRSTMPF